MKIELTKAEENILNHLWDLGEGTVQDVLARIEGEKKPSRTTVSTIIRILESKKIVSHRELNKRDYIYYPVLKREEYSRNQMFKLLKRYFNNSFASMTACFAKESDMTMEELDLLLEETKREIEADHEKNE